MKQTYLENKIRCLLSNLFSIVFPLSIRRKITTIIINNKCVTVADDCILCYAIDKDLIKNETKRMRNRLRVNTNIYIVDLVEYGREI